MKNKYVVTQMGPTSNISKETSYLTTFLILASSKIPLFKSPKHIFLAPAKSTPERYIFQTFPKTCSWKSRMKNIVKYDVYLDILLVGCIYVTKYRFCKESPKSILQPRHPGFGTGMHHVPGPGAWYQVPENCSCAHPTNQNKDYKCLHHGKD